MSDLRLPKVIINLFNPFRTQSLRRSALAPTLLAVMVASLGCAGSLRAHAALAAGDSSVDSGPVFATVEDAVLDAFEAARRDSGPGNRDRLRIGTIRRVEGGFAWSAPARSRTTVGAMEPMKVRVRFGPDDVAFYGIHPRSGLSDVDRHNEAVSSDVQRIVDEKDPLHRPIYVLTPSRRIVRYEHDPAALEVVSREAAGER